MSVAGFDERPSPQRPVGLEICGCHGLARDLLPPPAHDDVAYAYFAAGDHCDGDDPVVLGKVVNGTPCGHGRHRQAIPGSPVAMRLAVDRGACLARILELVGITLPAVGLMRGFHDDVRIYDTDDRLALLWTLLPRSHNI